MPTAPDPYVTFLASLRDAYAASGTPSSFTPGAQGLSPFGGAQSPDSPGGLATVGGAGGGSVPGTATTGGNLLESIVSGGLSTDPLQSGLPGRLFGQGGPSDPSGASQGEFDNLQGGNVNMLRAISMLGPLAPAMLLGQIVFDDATSGGGFGAETADLSNAQQPSGFGTNAPGVNVPGGLSFSGGGSFGGFNGGGSFSGGGGGLSFSGGGGGSFGSGVDSPIGDVDFDF